MSEERYPCVVYFRRRESERRANHFAHEQQMATEDALVAMNYKIVGRFGDPEFAPPYCGHLEPRPGWHQALNAAAEHAVGHSSCALIVLRADGIGCGDPFLPNLTLREKYAGIDIRLCHFSLRGHATTISLRDAHVRHRRFVEVEQDSFSGTVIDIGTRAIGGEILLRADPRKSLVRTYYANPSDDPVEIRWQAYSRAFLATDGWPRLVEWESLEIPPRKAIYLASFVKGDTKPQLLWWRFKVGKKRQTKVGNIIFAPAELSNSALVIDWYTFEPEGLAEDDFQWEDAPQIETSRLSFRNWRERDYRQYASISADDKVMRFLGGAQTDAESREDADYFKHLGLSGPTYWVLERKADKEFIGFCGILAVEESDSPVAGEWEIGWRLCSDAWGEGYAFEAASAVVSAAFETWSVDKIVSRIHPGNVASRRLAERLGMRENESRRHVPIGEDQFLLVYEMDEMQFWKTGRSPQTLETCHPNDFALASDSPQQGSASRREGQ